MPARCPALRVRSLFAYEAQREEDLGFEENRVLLAHPAKDPNGDWWYGSTEQNGSKFGWFPKSYVAEYHGTASLTSSQHDWLAKG